MNAKELRAKFEADLKAMQDSCDHKDKSEWMPYFYRIAAQDGEAMVCNHCDKIVGRRNHYAESLNKDGHTII